MFPVGGSSQAGLAKRLQLPGRLAGLSEGVSSPPAGPATELGMIDAPLWIGDQLYAKPIHTPAFGDAA
jgi:hypothetical protein